MGTEEKLYKKLQQAAENAEQKDFPGMEKIWARVEDKLETQTLQKEKHLWKKIAVAASVVLLGTLIWGSPPKYTEYNEDISISVVDKDNPTAKKEEKIFKARVYSYD